MKAFLLEQGWKLKIIHELDSLLDEAIKYKSEMELFKDLCERVSGYYFTQRYPIMEYIEVTCEDIEKDKIEALNLIKVLTEKKTTTPTYIMHNSIILIY